MSSSSCLWAKARENLPEDVKDWLASLEQGTRPNATMADDINRIIKQTRERQKDLGKSSHRFREYFDKIIHWLDKFKGIGDVVSSFDPVHAALPWAAFRFALQALLAEKEQADSVLELLASTPHLVFSGCVLERVYTKESMHGQESQEEVELGRQCLEGLYGELIKLYSALLSALKYCHSIASQHKVKRKGKAIFNSSEVVNIHKDLVAQHTKVLSCGETCRKVLNHTLSRKSLNLLRTIQPALDEITDRVQELLVRIDETERRKTLEDISAILYRAHHEEVSRKRTAGTCEWILKKDEFILWDESDSSVTILYGNPGAGKTFIISRVVDYTIEKAQMSEALAFFYCQRDEENRRNPRDILRSILRQLSTPMEEIEGDKIHVALRDLPNKLALNGTTFDVSTCETLIQKLVKDYSRTTIILDALDECDRNTREELMRVLSNLTNGISKVRVFISSRHDEDIRRHFKGVPVLELQARDNEEDIASFVEDTLFRDSRWTDLSPELQDELQVVFHEKSLGMFQWAALQVDQIRRLRIWSEKNIREQLKLLPTGLKGAYDVVWNQVQDMSPYEEQLARRALQWVLCASRPLHTAELSLMMVIDPDSGMTEANTVFTPEAIQSISRSLLAHDRTSNVWRFSHLSAREYIEKFHYRMLEAHHYVAISSIRFLERDLIWLPRNTRRRTEHRAVANPHILADQESPCVEYTATCGYMVKKVLWHVHEVDSPKFRSVELRTLLKHFFEPISNGSPFFQAWRQVWFNGSEWHHDSTKPYDSKSPDYLYTVQPSSRPLHVMSTFGVFHILRDLWEKAGDELDVVSDYAPSPLTLAIMGRHEPIWKFLLFANVKLDNGTPRPLAMAIKVDYPEAFEELLKTKPNLNEVDPHCAPLMRVGIPDLLNPNTPLKAALWRSKAENRRYFLQKLLEGGADMNLRPELPLYKEASRPLLHKTKGAYDTALEIDDDSSLLSKYQSALELSVKYADEDIVGFLLDMNTESRSPNHLLRLASWNTTSNLVPLLVRRGANIEQRWEGASPIVRALYHGNLPNVRSLLDMSDTRIDLSRQEYRGAVLSALKSYDGREIFHLLFQSAARIDHRNGEAPILDRAISLFDKYECELHKLGFPRRLFVPPFSKAASHHQFTLFEALLKAVADPSARADVRFGSALAEAAFHGRLHHCRAFLDHSEFDGEYEQGDPLRNVFFAVMSGHLSFVSWKFKDKWWRPLGEEILKPRHLEVLQLLFERGLNVYMPIYDTFGALIPVIRIDQGGHEISESCLVCLKGSCLCFSRFWFSIIWDLQNSTSPQLPLRLQLERWRFPGTLPPRVTIVARLTALSSAQPNCFIKFSLHGHHFQFIIARVHMKVHRSLSHISEDKRWKRYKPESFGVIRYSYQDFGVETSNMEVAGASRKFEASLNSLRGNSMVCIFLALIIGLFYCFFYATSVNQGNLFSYSNVCE